MVDRHDIYTDLLGRNAPTASSSLIPQFVLLGLINWSEVSVLESLGLQLVEILLQLAFSLNTDRLVYLRSLDMWSLRVLEGAWFTLMFLDVEMPLLSRI